MIFEAAADFFKGMNDSAVKSEQGLRTIIAQIRDISKSEISCNIYSCSWMHKVPYAPRSRQSFMVKRGIIQLVTSALRPIQKDLSLIQVIFRLFELRPRWLLFYHNLLTHCHLHCRGLNVVPPRKWPMKTMILINGR